MKASVQADVPRVAWESAYPLDHAAHCPALCACADDVGIINALGIVRDIATADKMPVSFILILLSIDTSSPMPRAAINYSEHAKLFFQNALITYKNYD